MTKILFTTPELEHPPRGGPKLRVENAIKALSRVSELVIACRVPIQYMGGEQAVEYYEGYCSKFVFLENTTAESHAQQLLHLAKIERTEIIWLGYGNISYEILYYLRKYDCREPIVVDTDSVWSRFLLRGLPYKPDFESRLDVFVSGWLKRWEEYWGTQLSDATTAVSCFDAEYYKIFTPQRDAVHIFSNVIDLDNYRQIPENVGIKKPCIYLAGTFGPNSPMEEAVLWMMDQVLPRVLKQVPDLHFYVVGVGATEQMLSRCSDNITITGPLESVLPYLGNADVAVVPLKYESGTRFKIMEAAACRVPIVSTTLGAEGLPLVNGQDILIANEPDTFCQAIVHLLQNPALGTMLAENCYRVVAQRCSIDAAISEARTIIAALVNKSRPIECSLLPSTELIAQLLYSVSRGANGYERVISAFSAFKFLMRDVGGHPLFIEGVEKQYTRDILKQTYAVAPNTIQVNEALELLDGYMQQVANVSEGMAECGCTPDQLQGQLTAAEIKSDPMQLLCKIEMQLQRSHPAATNDQLLAARRLKVFCLLQLGKLIEARQELELLAGFHPDNYSIKSLLEKTCMVIQYGNADE